MRRLSEAEVLNLKTILQLETMGIDKAMATQGIAKDKHIQELIGSSITAAEARIRGIQQFISENNVLEPGEVH